MDARTKELGYTAREIEVSMTRDEAFDLQMELMGALDFLERDGRIARGGDAPNLRRLLELVKRERAQ